MSARNVLVVALHPGSEQQIKDAIEQRHAVDDVNVRIVAPASTQTPLQWLMGDEDPARAEAEEVAREIARGRSAKTPLVVITGVGAVILGAAALLSLLLFLVLWLV